MDLVGRIFENGGLHITAFLGSGGFGSVWRGVQPGLNREVAVKVLDAKEADPTILDRFRQEGEAIARLDHPNIVRVFHYGNEDDLHYLVMNLLCETAGQRLASKRLPVGEILRLAVDVASALAHAHAHGVIHRDIKPGNIMFDRQGNAILTDFGLVCGTGFKHLTATNTFMGTAPYMSPEQISPRRFGSVGPRSDLYSLGCVIFELAAGRPPFQAEDPIAVAMKHLDEPAPGLADKAPDTPASLAGVVARLLEKRPEDRYGAATALKAELLRIARECEVDLRPAEGKESPELATRLYPDALPTLPIDRPSMVEHEPTKPVADDRAPASEIHPSSVVDQDSIPTELLPPAPDQPVLDEGSSGVSGAPSGQRPESPDSGVSGAPSGQRPESPAPGPPEEAVHPLTQGAEPPRHRRLRIGIAAGAALVILVLAIAYLVIDRQAPTSQRLVTVSPRGGETWLVGSEQTVRWDTGGQQGGVRIELSRDGGSSFPAVLAANTANDGAQDLIVPGPATNQARIRISSVTDQSVHHVMDRDFAIAMPPSFTLESPVAGERWRIGSQQTIRWVSEGDIQAVRIDLSTDGGRSFPIALANGLPNEGFHRVVVPGPTTVQGRIRVSSITDSSVSQVSGGDFAILSRPIVTLTAPVGGERWPIGSTQTVRWTSDGLEGNVRIELSRDAGRGFAVIADSTQDDGSFAVTVSGPPTTRARIRISSVADSSVSSLSPGNVHVYQEKEEGEEEQEKEPPGQGVLLVRCEGPEGLRSCPLGIVSESGSEVRKPNGSLHRSQEEIELPTGTYEISIRDPLLEVVGQPVQRVDVKADEETLVQFDVQ